MQLFNDSRAGRGMVVSVQELLQCLETSGQMSSKPFPSHLFALLYFVIHSPHPVVCGIIGTQYMTSQVCSTTQGRSNLTFFWFILRTAGLVVPSFNLVKSFQLPGYLPPRRVSYCEIYIYYLLFNLHHFFCSVCHHRISILLHYNFFNHITLSWNSETCFEFGSLPS